MSGQAPSFVSLFTGIRGIDLGLERAGWRCLAQVEIDKACRRVIARRSPGVPLFGDVREFGAASLRDALRAERSRSTGDDRTTAEGAERIHGEGRLGAVRLRETDREERERQAERDGADAEGRHGSRSRSGGRVADGGDDDELAVDLLCGGFPCQDVSVAGRRAGLAGARSGLFFEFLRVAREIHPRWLLVENVPGLLSSNDGRDFAVILGELGAAGYFMEWRVLDSRWFGVAQRRRRVFLVGHLGGPSAAPVLFESEGSGRDPAASGASREIAAGDLARSLGRVGGGDDYGANKGTLVAGTLGHRGADGGRTTDLDGHGAYVVSPTLGTHVRPGNEGNDTGVVVSEAVTSKWRKGTGGPSGDETQNLVWGIRSDAVRDGVAKTPSADAEGSVRLRDPGLGIYEELAPTIDAGQAHIVANALRASDGHDSEDGSGRQPALVVIAPALAAPLTSGSHPNSAIPSRHMEDDQNLVLRVVGNDHTVGTHATLESSRGAGREPVIFRKSKRAADDQDDETWVPDDYANTLNAFDGGDKRAVELVAFSSRAIRNSDSAHESGIKDGTIHDTLQSDGPMAVAVPTILKKREGRSVDSGGESAGKGELVSEDISLTLPRNGSEQTLFDASAVRRLTPTECERLQAFPDGWTCTCDASEPYSSLACRCPDGPRYAMLGNAVTVSVAEWVGRRIRASEESRGPVAE